jgi:PAS domain S-box-containing protein
VFKKAINFISLQGYFDSLGTDDILERQRMVLFRIYTYAAFFICTLLALAAIPMDGLGLLWPSLIFIDGLIFLANYFLLPQHNKKPLAYTISILASFAVVHMSTYYSGGIRNSSMFFLGAVVLLSYMLLGSKNARWIVFLFIANVVFFYVITPNGELTGTGLVRNLVKPEDINTDHLVSFGLGIAFIAALANYLESKKNVVIERITESRDLLAAQNIELQKLSIVASKTDNGVLITNKDGNIEYSNDGLTRLLGYNHDEVAGQSPWEVFNGIETDTVETEKLQDSIKNGQSFSGEFRQKHKEGHYTWVGVTATPIIDDGKVSRYVFINADINERKAAEEKMRQYTDNLEKAFKELDKFAYVVSHDLKAPLRAIFNLSNWITEDYSDQMPEEAREMFERIRGRVLRMESLIEGILAYSKIDRKEDVFTDIDLNKQLHDSLDLIDVPKDFIIDIPQDLPIVKGDQSKIHQVFMNLLSNAIKFNDKPAGEGLVKVGCEDDGEYWKFTVTDNGPGIEPQYHEKIFVIFQTLNARDTFESTGVGLAIVKKIVEEMGGKIWLESELGVGTSFYFTMAKDPAAHRKTFLVAA